MELNKSNIIISLVGLAGTFTASVGTGLISEKTPMSVKQCNIQADQEEASLRREIGYDISDDARNEVLRIYAMQRYCIEEAKAGPRLSLAGL